MSKPAITRLIAKSVDLINAIVIAEGALQCCALAPKGVSVRKDRMDIASGALENRVRVSVSGVRELPDEEESER